MIKTTFLSICFRVSSKTGHYTQVAWANSEEIGCGMVYYKSGKWYKTLVFCNYATGGNWRGSTMYEVGRACSKCPEGYSCEDGLCVRGTQLPPISTLSPPITASTQTPETTSVSVRPSTTPPSIGTKGDYCKVSKQHTMCKYRV